MSWISRDKTYRVQIQGHYVGQRRVFAEAARLLAEAQKDLIGTMDRYAKDLPVGVTYIKGRDSYRVRVRGVDVIQTKDLAKAIRYKEAAQKRLKELEK